MLNSFNNRINSNEDQPVFVSLDFLRAYGLQQLRSKVAGLRASIASQQVKNWLLFSESSFHYLCGLIALLSLGKKVIVCANPSNSWLKTIDSEFDAILSDREIDVADKVGIDLLYNPCNKTTLDPIHLSGSEQIVFFTSGSTGEPKGIQKTWRCLTNELATLESTFINERLSFYVAATVSHLHIYGLLFKVLWPFVTNRAIVEDIIEYPEQLNQIQNLLNNEPLSGKFALISSPAFLARLDLTLPAVSPLSVFSSGGPLAFGDAQNVASLMGVLPTEIYGSTESGGIAYRRQEQLNQLWRVFDRIKLQVDSHLVQLSSPHITTQESIILDDQVRIENSVSEGQLFSLVGRKDRIVKLEEKRVSLTEVEKFVENFDSVERCVALVITNKRQYIGCVVTLTASGYEYVTRYGFNSLVKLWKSKMRQHFEAITLPRKWRYVSEFPLNSQSKIENVALYRLFDISREEV